MNASTLGLVVMLITLAVILPIGQSLSETSTQPYQTWTLEVKATKLEPASSTTFTRP